MTGGKELVIQAAVSLLATGRAKDGEQAVTLALRLVDEVDKVLTRRVAASRAARGAASAGARSSDMGTVSKARTSDMGTVAKARTSDAGAVAKAPAKATPVKAGAKATRPRRAVGGASASGSSTIPATTLPIRPRRLLEKLGLLQQDAETSPRELMDKLCEAHLAGAKGSSAATVKQIAAWFKAHGAQLPKECATYDANWLTNRCDETPEE